MSIRYYLLGLSLLCLLACRSDTKEHATVVQEDLPDNPRVKAARELFWKELEDRFIRDCLNPFLTSRHIQPDCSGCDRFRVTLALTVDNKGAVTATRKGTRACPILTAKDMEVFDQQIGSFFKQVTLPTTFHNQSYEVNWDFLLRC